MSVIYASALTFSCPSNQNQNSKFSHKSSIPLHIFRAHCSLRIPVSSYHHQISSLHIFRAHCSLRIPVSSYHHQIFSTDSFNGISKILSMEKLVLIDLDPATAKLVIPFLGPFLSAFGFLFIVRIVMSWYPKLPVEKFPYVIAYAPTEPLLVQTRKVIPPLGGVDVTPVVWFGLISFLNEILVGPQGLLVLLSQQV